MNIQKALHDLSERMFNIDYEQFLSETLCELQQDPLLRKIESDYKNTQPVLCASLTKDQRNAFIQMEAQFDQCKTYAARYSFYCGLYAGFGQHFRDSAPDGDFQTLVQEGLLQNPGMKDHPRFSKEKQGASDCADRLTEENPGCADLLSAILLAWDERIHSAARLSFYCGYRAALSTVGRVNPGAYPDVTAQALMTEYKLGLTLPL